MIGLMEWGGCLSGILGAFLLALNRPFSRYGWLAYLFSNIAWIIYSLMAGVYGLLFQQSVFIVTSVIGIMCWFSKRKYRL